MVLVGPIEHGLKDILMGKRGVMLLLKHLFPYTNDWFRFAELHGFSEIPILLGTRKFGMVYSEIWFSIVVPVLHSAPQTVRACMFCPVPVKA